MLPLPYFINLVNRTDAIFKIVPLIFLRQIPAC